MFWWRNRLIYILDGLRVSTFSANFLFWVYYSFKCRCKCGQRVILWGGSLTLFPPGEQVSGGGVAVIFKGLEPQLEGEEPRILGAEHHYRIKYFCEWYCSATYMCRMLHVPLNLHHFLSYHASNLASSGSSPSWNTRNRLKRTFPPTCQKHTHINVKKNNKNKERSVRETAQLETDLTVSWC